MAKPRRGPRVKVTHVKANGIRCPLCPANLIAGPGKDPAKILAAHIKRRHGGTRQVP